MSQKTELEALQRLSVEMTSLGSLIAGAEQLKPLTTRNPVRVTLLSGFLGAGKTTLLQRVLARDDGQKIGVIVNDFGAVNLDADILDKSKNGVFRLENGCACCAMAGNLSAAMEALINTESPPDHIFIEASGVSDPTPMAVTAEQLFGSGTCRIVTVVDCVAWRETLPNTGMKLLRQKQIEAAHLIIVSKSQGLPADELRKMISALAGMAPGRPIIDAAEAELAEQAMLEPHFSGARPQPDAEPHDLSIFASRTFIADKSADQDEVSGLLGQAPPAVIRIKGSINLTTQKQLNVQVVGSVCELAVGTLTSDAPSLVVIYNNDDDRALSVWIDRLSQAIETV